MPDIMKNNDCFENELYIFISYSVQDEKRLLKIYSELTEMGYNVLYNKTEENDVQKGISNCQYFIALISENYISSRLYDLDLQYSIDLKKETLLLFIDDDMSLFDKLPERQKWRLSSIQHLRYDNGNYRYNLPVSNEMFSSCHKTNDSVSADTTKEDEFGVYNGNKPYIFISYSHLDSAVCDDISKRFIKEGFRIWNDRGIPSGKGWDDVIGNRLNHCDVFIGLISRNYLHSQNCIAEMKRASTCTPGPNKSFLIFIEDLPFSVLPEGTQMYLNGKDQWKYSSEEWFEQTKKIRVIYDSLDITKYPVFASIVSNLDKAEKAVSENEFDKLNEYLNVKSFYELCLNKKFHSGNNINVIVKEGYRFLYLLEAYGLFAFGNAIYQNIHTKLSDVLNILTIRHEIDADFSDIKNRIEQLPKPQISDIKIDISLNDDISADMTLPSADSLDYTDTIDLPKNEINAAAGLQNIQSPLTGNSVNDDIVCNKKKEASKSSKSSSFKNIFIIVFLLIIISAGILTIYFSTTYKMPYVLHMNVEDAIRMFDELDMEYNIYYSSKQYEDCGYGCVFNQTPAPGSRKSKDFVVKIGVSLFEDKPVNDNINSNDNNQSPEASSDNIECIESPMSGTLYISENCYATKYPQNDSECVAQYSKGDLVNIVAYADNGYYRLLNGGYVLSSRCSSEPPASDDKQVNLSEIKPGDEIPFGNYTWLVLDKKDNKALITSKDILAIKAYNDTFEEVTWETCSLRSYLNNDFYNSFSDDEKSRIIDTTLVNNDSNHMADVGYETTDKIFIQSIAELRKYFGTDEYDPNKYNIDIIKDWIWVRDPGHKDDTAMGVYMPSLEYSNDKSIDSNYINPYGCQVHYEVGICPTMWINLSQ